MKSTASGDFGLKVDGLCNVDRCLVRFDLVYMAVLVLYTEYEPCSPAREAADSCHVTVFEEWVEIFMIYPHLACDAHLSVRAHILK